MVSVAPNARRASFTSTMVTRGDGSRVLLDYVLGPGFALMCHAVDVKTFVNFACQPHGIRSSSVRWLSRLRVL